MPPGNTTTAALDDSLPTVIASARQVREYAQIMPNLVDKHTLGKGIGNTWNEISMEQLTAQGIAETTILDNPQQIVDTLFSVTPTVVGIQTLITDRVMNRISKNAFAQMGSLAQHAVQRRKDEDGLIVFQGATTDLGPGAGSTYGASNISAAAARILGNATEPGLPPLYTVLHPFALKDIQDEIVFQLAYTPNVDEAVGSPSSITGLTAKVLQQGFYKGHLFDTAVITDGNMSIDAGDDAIGGVFAKMAIVLVQGRSPYTKTRAEPHIGGGANSMFFYDEFAYGERSAGNWLFGETGDATAPT